MKKFGEQRQRCYGMDGLVQRLYIGAIDVDGDRLHNLLNGDHQPARILLLDQSALPAGEGAVLDAHATADLEIRVRLNRGRSQATGLQSRDVFGRERDHLSRARHQTDDPKSFEHAHALRRGDLHEDVARKQRRAPALYAVAPTRPTFVCGQQAGELFLFELKRNLPFVARPRVGSQPTPRWGVLIRRRYGAGDICISARFGHGFAILSPMRRTGDSQDLGFNVRPISRSGVQ